MEIPNGFCWLFVTGRLKHPEGGASFCDPVQEEREILRLNVPLDRFPALFPFLAHSTTKQSQGDF